jgi:DNA adenine methylase
MKEHRLLAKPFLKWAGGKNSLLPYLRSLVPNEFVSYIEPFLGGGAFFFDLKPKQAILADLNPELINCYKVVKENPDELIELLARMRVSKEFYYEIRAKKTEEMSELQRASRLIYLNKTCYNGLYRVNKKGQFNTPFGRNTSMNICNAQNIKLASEMLKNAILIEGDFETILLKYAQKGDFIYLDPPYPSVGRFSDFKRYTKDFFCENDHRRLAKVVREIAKRECLFILSNAKHDLVTELYEDFRKIDVEAPRFINCRGGARGNVPEVFITNITIIEETSFSPNQIYGQ